MSPHTSRLALACVIFFAVTGFLSIGFATHNHVVVECVNVDYKFKARYGLFEMCYTDMNAEEVCDPIDYSKVEYVIGGPDSYHYTYYENNCSTQFAVVVTAFTAALLISMLIVVPCTHSVSQKYLYSLCVCYSLAGLIGIIATFVFTHSVIEAYDNLKNCPEFEYRFTKKRSWSFFIYMAANIFMIIGGVGALVLTSGYSAAQMFFIVLTL